MEGIVVVDVAHSLITAVRPAIPNITLATQTAAATLSAKISATVTEMFASVFVRLNYMTASESFADNNKLGGDKNTPSRSIVGGTNLWRVNSQGPSNSRPIS